MTDHLPESPEVAPSADHLTSKWRDASAAARKAEHHWPADCLAEAADVVDRLNAQAAEHEREVAGLRAERDELNGWIEQHALVKTLARISEWQEATGAELPAMARAALHAYANRAEAAERALADLRAGIEALADAYDNRPHQTAQDAVNSLRALLATGDRHDESKCPNSDAHSAFPGMTCGRCGRLTPALTEEGR